MNVAAFFAEMDDAREKRNRLAEIQREMTALFAHVQAPKGVTCIYVSREFNDKLAALGREQAALGPEVLRLPADVPTIAAWCGVVIRPSDFLKGNEYICESRASQPVVSIG